MFFINLSLQERFSIFLHLLFCFLLFCIIVLPSLCFLHIQLEVRIVTVPSLCFLHIKFGTAWVRRFCKRWNISLRKKANAKCKSVFQRLHQAKNYDKWLIYHFQDPKYWDEPSGQFKLTIPPPNYLPL